VSQAVRHHEHKRPGDLAQQGSPRLFAVCLTVSGDLSPPTACDGVRHRSSSPGQPSTRDHTGLNSGSHSAGLAVGHGRRNTCFYQGRRTLTDSRGRRCIELESGRPERVRGFKSLRFRSSEQQERGKRGCGHASHVRCGSDPAAPRAPICCLNAQRVRRDLVPGRCIPILWATGKHRERLSLATVCCYRPGQLAMPGRG
jgi:hypothetical protein